jgi:hypothetical protein
MLSDLDPLTLGRYLILLALAIVVLAFALEFVAYCRDLISESANARRWLPLDRRVLFRLTGVGGTVALAVAAAIIMGYSADPQRTSWLLAWPRDHHPSLLLLIGAMFCLVALVCGVGLRQPVLLFCLTLPGVVILPLLWLPDIVKSNHVVDAVLTFLIIFPLQPGMLVLLFICIGQARQLRKPDRNFTLDGFVRVGLISIAYVYGFITQ